jgi:putative endonuclease
MAKRDGASRGDPAAKSAPTSPMTASRAGLFARTPAASTANGCRILAKRFRTPHGEIDMVAKRRNLFAFVEVKARATFDEAAFAVTSQQKSRMIDAAQAWLTAQSGHGEFERRFDELRIAPHHLPRHVLAAFDASP